MRCVTVLALALAGWLIPQLAGAQTASVDTRIVVYITAPERDGFVDTDKELTDSIRDLQNNIRNKRGLLVAKDRTSADVVLRVNNRGRASEATGGVVAVPLGNGAIAAPIHATYKFVETTLEAGTFKKDFNAADDGYGDCAEKIARQVNAWIEANHSTLMEHRATRVR